MRALRFALPLAVATCATLILSACSSAGGTSSSPGATSESSGGSGATSSGNTSGKQVVIGWANPQAKQPIFTTFTDALNAAAARENIKIITLDGQADPSVQVSDIQTFITQKVDAIIVFPLVPPAEAAILNKAHAAGIKIIGLNAILPPDFGVTPTVSAPYDTNLDLGYVSGAHTEALYIAQQLQGKGNVVGIKIPVPVPSLVAMMNTFQKYVTLGNPGIKWLGTLPDATDDLAGARSSMADAITRYHGDIQAVAAYTDIAAIGAYQALSAAGIKGTVIVGQQGNQTGVDALKAGQIQGDVDAEPYTAAVWALALAKAVVAGQTVPKFVSSPTTFLTKDNVNTYVPWSDGVSQIKSGQTSLKVTFGN